MYALIDREVSMDFEKFKISSLKLLLSVQIMLKSRNIYFESKYCSFKQY